MSGGRYGEAGVDLARAESARERIASLVKASRTPNALGGVGGFGGMVRVPPGFEAPVLVMSTDGVGTKVLVARAAGRYSTVGEDLVNHSVNDILVHGAAPLAFLDYIAGAGLTVEQIESLVEGVARGCRAHRMDLAGGETAQMPGLYREGDFDLAGTIVGVVEESRAIHGDAIAPGDVLIGYESTGLHTNGYTLARKIIFDQEGLGLDDRLGETGQTVADALLAGHRSYYDAAAPVLPLVSGLAHITGGGIAGNLVRVLPRRCEARINPASWEVPPLFRYLQSAGSIAPEEMREVFNLGVGFIAVAPPDRVAAVREAAARAEVGTWVIGEIGRGERRVRFG
ncbi:MAG TPA: phosphoribosylformylglycinamidine cyclo-ligase [Gemmatimonadales bacterium]|nr:phosphoribosylformylglycinamidine cyclo-ligase [Gemmatimonadales bacterium]